MERPVEKDIVKASICDNDATYADLKISDLSKHLFWDIDASQLDIDRNKGIIIQRVLKYGLISDWEKVFRYYQLNQIVSVTKTIRDLDDKTLSFISALSKTPKEAFLCYSMKQSTPRHWNF